MFTPQEESEILFNYLDFMATLLGLFNEALGGIVGVAI